MIDEGLIVAISALQHWLYCPRQCALIHVEREWAENRYTAEGRVMHEKAHGGPDETHRQIRISRGLPVSSRALGLSGQCDVVEFHGDGAVIPVEYKRGKPKSHRADELQLCAQGICLEEMLGIGIPFGYLFYGKPHRRTEVQFDEGLRALVRETAEEIRRILLSGETPTAEYLPSRCDACSLIDVCQPRAMRFRRGTKSWFTSRLLSDADAPPP